VVLLAVALACFAVLPAVVVLGTRGQSAERAGVARSILTIERRYATAMDVTAERSFHERVLAPLAARLGNLGTTLTPTAAVRRLQRQLDYAGNPATWPVERVVAAKGIGLVAGLGGGALFGLALGGGRTLLLAALCGGALGFLFPDISIYNAGVKRQDAMRSSLPDVLDTLTICVEAGQGFDAALAQVSRNGRGPMAGETARCCRRCASASPGSRRCGPWPPAPRSTSCAASPPR
jgi:tight adherence protein C